MISKKYIYWIIIIAILLIVSEASSMDGVDKRNYKNRVLSYRGTFSMPTQTSENLTSSQLNSIVRRPKDKPKTTSEKEKYRPGDYTKFQQQLVDQALELKPESKPFNLSSKENRVSFLKELIHSESSDRLGVVTTDIDGKKYTGLGQFGTDRLADYKKATGEEFNIKDFKNSRELQMKVMDWHINDIDKKIELLGKDEGLDIEKFDRNGLRSVAHLGGLTGMRKFIKTNMKYNPKDSNGTSLKDYYNKFSDNKTVGGSV